MESHAYVAVVTALALLVYLWTVIGVGAARRRSGIKAPTMTGDPLLERAVRVQANTLEWLPIFLPSLWLCHLSGSRRIRLGSSWQRSASFGSWGVSFMRSVVS